MNVWCITVCVSVCMQKPFLLGEKTAFQLLSGSYQNGTDHLPLLSYQCRVNCLSEEKQNRGGCVCVCVPCRAVRAIPFFLVCCLFFSSFSINLGYCTIRMQGPVPGLEGLQSIIWIVYLIDRNKLTWQQLIQTTSQGDGSEGRWRGEIEGRTDKWKWGREREGKERWAGFGTQTSLFCERYTGQGCSRSHVMLDGFQWGVCDRMRSSGRGGWVCWGRHMYQVVMQECHAPYQCCIRMLCVCVCVRAPLFTCPAGH